MVMSNEHIPTEALRQRISDLVMAGTPLGIIAEIIELNDDTIRKYYSKELKTAKSIAIERIAKTVYSQAVDGDSKAQALYLKTQGASQGWVEKQIVENVASEDTQALKDKIAELEDKFARDY